MVAELHEAQGEDDQQAQLDMIHTAVGADTALPGRRLVLRRVLSSHTLTHPAQPRVRLILLHHLVMKQKGIQTYQVHGSFDVNA